MKRLSKSRIPYLDAVWNVVTGCGDAQVSPGCLNCYARTMTGRNLWGYDWAPRFHEDRLEAPLHHKKPLRIGVTFMGDLYHEGITDEQRWAVYEVMEQLPRHTFVDLTKRTKDRHDFLRSNEDVNDGWPLPNLWQGSTICNQPEADRDIPVLLDTPAAVRFVSVEPMLGPVDLTPWFVESRDVTDDLLDAPDGATVDGMERVGDEWKRRAGLDWVICGGEAGPGARPMEPEWVVDLHGQCKAAGVPFWFKGVGSWWQRNDAWRSDEDAWIADTKELPAVAP